MILHPTLDEVLALTAQGNLCPALRRGAGRPRDAGVGLPEGRARPLLVPARVRRGRRAPGALQLHRHGAVPHRPLRPRCTTRRRRPAARGRGGAGALSSRWTCPGLPRFTGGAVGYLGYECVALLRAARADGRERRARRARVRASCSPTRCSSSTTCSTRSRSSATSASTATSRRRTARRRGGSRSWSGA